MEQITPAVKVLLVLNVFIFYAQNSLGAHLLNSMGLRSMLSGYFSPYQFFTYTFVHADLSHLVKNMIALNSFGPIMEKTLGTEGFIAFYVLTGVGAAIVYKIVNSLKSWRRYHRVDTTLVGASGSICGLFVAFAMLFPDREVIFYLIPVPIKATYAILGYSIYELYSIVKDSPVDRVAHAGHLGGILSGYLLVTGWKNF